MTSQEFQSRYRLLHPLSEAGAHSHLATSPTGAIVMVHFLDTDTEQESNHLLWRLDSLQGEARSRILEIEEVDGRPAVVTRFLQDFVSLPAWLDGCGAPPAPGKKAPGEFTSLFGAVGASRTEVPEPRPEPPAAPDPVPRPEAGEFTRLFGAVAPPPAPDPAPRPPEAPAQPPAGPSEPGEFTRTFGAMTPPAHDTPARGAEAPAEPPSAPAGPGEFTRLFRAAEVSSPESPPAPRSQETPSDRAASPAAPPTFRPEPPAPPPAGGEFTRMFRTLSGSPPAAPPPPQAPPAVPPGPPLLRPQHDAPAPDGYLDRLHSGGGPSRMQPPVAPGEAPPPRAVPELPPLPSQMAPPGPQPGSAPGAYTRLIAAQQPPPPPPAAAPATPAAPPAANPASARPPRRLGLLVGLAVIALVALLLIGYLLLRAGPEAQPPAGAPGDTVPAAEPATA